MTYRYGIKNAFRPSQLAPRAYGWTSGRSYSAADVPSRWVDETDRYGSDQLEAQFAYEWYQSGERFAGFTGESGLTNPPFVSGAAGRLHPLLMEAATGRPARILRGYIRRADYDLADEKSKARLYFMYNPETITREYVSYLEQSALDPFNTVYQSGNLIAPPSIMNFSFELFFDRQEECAGDSTHPGVFVDYQFFDLVVRNVVPTDPNQSNNMLPDNGVMMVNPRDITVVFSPQISVQGRPINAQVTFEKFTHRMTPIRMRIQLTILASYFGPVRDMVEYKQEEMITEDTIPYDDIADSDLDITFEAVERSADASNGIPGNTGSDAVAYDAQMGQLGDANQLARLKALDWARDDKNVNESTKYVDGNSGSKRWDLPKTADCSGLVTRAYVEAGYGDQMGWKGYPGTGTIITQRKREASVYRQLDTLDWRTDLMPGDLLMYPGHIAFFVAYQGGSDRPDRASPVSGLLILDASSPSSRPQVGERPVSGVGKFKYLLRPTPLGTLGSAAQAPTYNSGPTSNVGGFSLILTKEQTVIAETGNGPNIRLSPAALPAWNAWRAAWNGAIPCTSGWRDPVQQQADYEAWERGNHGWHRYAPAASSYHCKGLAVDVNQTWLNALSASDQTKLRNAAVATGWGQARWRKKEGPMPGYEAACNWQNGTDTYENWHFSYGGCG